MSQVRDWLESVLVQTCRSVPICAPVPENCLYFAHIPVFLISAPLGCQQIFHLEPSTMGNKRREVNTNRTFVFSPSGKEKAPHSALQMGDSYI